MWCHLAYLASRKEQESSPSLFSSDFKDLDALVTPGDGWQTFQAFSRAWSSRRDAVLEAQVELPGRSEEHTSELQSLMRISYAVFCLKKKKLGPITEQQTNATKSQNHTKYPISRSNTKHQQRR